MAIFDHAHPKIIEQIFSFPDLYQHAENQFILSVNFWDTVNFKVLSPQWPDLFLTMNTPKIFKAPLNFCRSVSTCKKTVILSVHSKHLLISINLYQHAKFTKFHLSWNYCRYKRLKWEVIFRQIHAINVSIKFWFVTFDQKGFF